MFVHFYKGKKMNFRESSIALVVCYALSVQCCAEAQPTKKPVVVSFDECPQMKKLNGLIISIPVIFKNLVQISNKAKEVLKIVESQETLVKASTSPDVEQKILHENVDVLVSFAKKPLGIVRENDALLLPIVRKITENAPSLFTDFLSSKQDPSTFFHANVTSLATLKTLCTDLMFFAHSIYASLSDDAKKIFAKQPATVGAK